MNRWALKFATLAFGLVLLASPAAFAAKADWVGVWNVKDSAGQAFQITLTDDGNAKASLHEDMVGTWSEKKGAAVIKWKTGWTTKIAKSGDGFKKTGYRKGSKKPSNSSEATKAQ